MIAALVTLVAGYGASMLVWPHPSPAGVRRCEPAGRAVARAAAHHWPAIPAAAVGTLAGLALFGAPVPAAVVGASVATTPGRIRAQRAAHRRAVAHHAWPHLIEEIRVETASLGRSIPAATFAAGRRAPAELRAPFLAAEREWLLTTDLEAALNVLRDGLADPTADATAETLGVAHAVGGVDLDRRLADLAEDRRQEVQARKDAESRLAGARFARRFVLLVPAGMAAAGMGIGTGRAAYATPSGQVLTVVAILIVGLCWAWAGAVMRLPRPSRVFGSDRTP